MLTPIDPTSTCCQADAHARAASDCLQLPLRQLPAVARELHALATTCHHDIVAELCTRIVRGAEASGLRLTAPVRSTERWLRLVAALTSRVDSARPVVMRVLDFLSSRLQRGAAIRCADAAALRQIFEDDSSWSSAVVHSLVATDRQAFEAALQALPGSTSGARGQAAGGDDRPHRRAAIERARRLYRLLRPFRRGDRDDRQADLSFIGVRKAHLQYATWRDHAHLTGLSPLVVTRLGRALARLLVDDPSPEVVLVATLLLLEVTPAELRAIYRGPATSGARVVAGRFEWTAHDLRKAPSVRRSAHLVPTTTIAGFALPLEYVRALGPDPATPVRLDVALGVSDELLDRANALLKKLVPLSRPLTVSALSGVTRMLIAVTDDDALAVAMTGSFVHASPAVIHYIFATADARNDAARRTYRAMGFSGEISNPLTDSFALNSMPSDDDLGPFISLHLRHIHAVAQLAPIAGADRLIRTYCMLGIHVGVVLQLLTGVRECRRLPFAMRGIDLSRGFAVSWDKASSDYWTRRLIGLCTLAIDTIATFVRVSAVVARRLQAHDDPLGELIAATLTSDSARPLLNTVVGGVLRPIGAADIRRHFAIAGLDLNCGRRLTLRVVREAGMSSVVASAQVGHGVEGQEAFGSASALAPASTLAHVARAWDMKLAALKIPPSLPSRRIEAAITGQSDLCALPVSAGDVQACPFPLDLAHRLRVMQVATAAAMKQPPEGTALLVVSLILRDGICRRDVLRAVLTAIFVDGIRVPASGESVRLVVADVPVVGLRNVRVSAETLRAAAVAQPTEITCIDALLHEVEGQAEDYCHRILGLGRSSGTALTTLLAAVEATWVYRTPGIVRAFAQLQLVGRATCTDFALGSSQPVTPARSIQASFDFEGELGARVAGQLDDLRRIIAGIARAKTRAVGHKVAREEIRLLMDRPDLAEMVRECCSVALQHLGRSITHTTLASYVTAVEPFVTAVCADLDMSFADMDFAAEHAKWEWRVSDASTENRRKRSAMVTHISNHLGLGRGTQGARTAVQIRRAVPGLRMHEVVAAQQRVALDPHVPTVVRDVAARIGIIGVRSGGRHDEIVHLRGGDVLQDLDAAIVFFSHASGAAIKSDNGNRVVGMRLGLGETPSCMPAPAGPADQPLFSTVQLAEQGAAAFVAALRSVASRDGVRFHTLRALFCTERLMSALTPGQMPSIDRRGLFAKTAVEVGHWHHVVSADHYFFEVDSLIRAWWDECTSSTPVSDALLCALSNHSRANVRQRRRRTGLIGADLLNVLFPLSEASRRGIVKRIEAHADDRRTQCDCAGGAAVEYRDLIAYLLARHSAGSSLLAARGTRLSAHQIGELEASLSYLRRLGRHDALWPNIQGNWSADDKDKVLGIAVAIGAALKSNVSLLSLCTSMKEYARFVFAAPDDLQSLPIAVSLAATHSVQLRIRANAKAVWEAPAASCGIYRVIVGGVSPGHEAMLGIKRTLPDATRRCRRDEHDYVWSAAVAAMTLEQLRRKGAPR
jgi:hypothetical protein